MSGIPVLNFSNEGEGLRVDLDKLIANRMLIQASSGGGKSWALRSLLEGTHGRVQQFVIDPEGEFATLREKFDYVLAGKDADVPAHPSSARVLCRELMKCGASAVLDIYDLLPEDRRLFVQLFLEELVNLPKNMWHPLIVAIDEAHTFCPEVGKVESSEAVKALISLGRKRGFAAVCATQRIQKFHKDAAAELRNKIIGLTNMDVDLKRAGDELGFSRVEAQRLRSLDPGHFYINGPALSRDVRLAKTGAVQTTHPEAGKIRTYAHAPASASLKEVLDALKNVPKQAEEEARTVTELQERVELLQSALSAARANYATKERIVEKPVEKIIHVPVLREGELEGLREFAHNVLAMSKDMHALASDILVTVQTVEAKDTEWQNAESAVPPVPEHVALERPANLQVVAPTTSRPRKYGAGTGAKLIHAKQQEILDTMAVFDALGVEEMLMANIAVLTRQSPKSSLVEAHFRFLRDAGCIHMPRSRWAGLTDRGRNQARLTSSITTLNDLHNAWYAALGKWPRMADILRVLIASHPEPVGFTQLAHNVGLSPTSSGYEGYLRDLRDDWGLIRSKGKSPVSLVQEMLFPKGLK